VFLLPVYVGHGLTRTTGNGQGYAKPCGLPGGYTLVVTKTDRLARSLPDVRAIVDGLTARQRSSRLPGSCRT